MIEVYEARRMIGGELDEKARQVWRNLPTHNQNDFAGPVAGDRRSIEEAVKQFEVWLAGGHA